MVIFEGEGGSLFLSTRYSKHGNGLRLWAFDSHGVLINRRDANGSDGDNTNLFNFKTAIIVAVSVHCTQK